MSDYLDHYTNSRALIVGINVYPHAPTFNPLGEAERDAMDLAEMLESEPYNFSVRTLLAEEATRTAILDALYELRAAAGPDERVIFYFAGHGYTLSDNFGHETGYLACYDSVPERDHTALRMDEVTDFRKRCKAKHIAFIFDACFSGQALGLTRTAAVAAERFMHRRAYHAISAGGPEETVVDYRSMTRLLLRALKQPALVDEQMLTIERLGAFLKNSMAAESGSTQTPQCGQLQGSGGGDMVLYLRTQQAPLEQLPARLRRGLSSADADTRYFALAQAESLLADQQHHENVLQVLKTLSTDDPDDDVRKRAFQAVVKTLSAQPPVREEFKPQKEEPAVPKEEGFDWGEWLEKGKHVSLEDLEAEGPRLNGTVCVETVGGVATPLLWEGDKLPASASQIFSTADDKQTQVELHLTFGGNDKAKDNLSLGKFVLDGIPPAPRGVPQIEVSYTVDENLRLSVEAKDKASGYSKKSENIDLGKLTAPKVVSPLPPRETPVDTSSLNASDFLKEIFGDFNLGERSRARRTIKMPGKDLQVPLELSLEEVALGSERLVDFNRLETCRRCQGTGDEPGIGKTCATCNGTGEVRERRKTTLGDMVQVNTCKDCNGKGRIDTKPCTNCAGKGLEQRTRSVIVKIPAGIDTSKQLRLAGEGDKGEKGGPAGNVFVAITVKEHPLYRRSGNDLILEYPLEAASARRGGTLQVPLIEGGKTSLKYRANSQSGTLLRARGKGVGKTGDKGRGDLLVELDVFEPRKMEAKHRERLNLINAALKEA